MTNRLRDDLKFIGKRPKLIAKRLLNIRDELSYLTVLKEIFIQQSYRWLVEDLKPGTTAIDIGAYKGETAIYLAMPDGIKKVIAIEPSRQAFIVAEKQVKESQLGGKIHLINNSVSKEGGGTSDSDAPSSSIYQAKASASSEKKSLMLKDVVKMANSDRIIIKCDAEGAEKEIFDCDPGALDGVYRMQIEYHDTFPELNQLLTDRGFHVKQMDDHEGIFYKRVGYVQAWR